MSLSFLSKRRRLSLLAGSGIAALMFVSSPASANVFRSLQNIVSSGGNYLNSFGPLLERAGVPTDQIGGYLGEANTYVRSLSGFYRAVTTGNLQSIVGSAEDVSGALGYPDLFRVRSIRQRQRELEPSSAPLTRASSITELAELDRLGVSGIADAVLGEAGQALMASQLEMGALAAEAAAEAAMVSQQAGDSQEVLKAIAVQQAAQAAIESQILSSLQTIAIQEAAGNTLLVDVSAALDRANSDRLYQRLNSIQTSMSGSTGVFIPYLDSALEN